MAAIKPLLVSAVILLVLVGCGASESSPQTEDGVQIIFLHHSTGGVVWEGGVPQWFDDNNAANGTDYAITDRAYPGEGYPWDNYPYDYWNIWVEHAGKRRFKKQDTLEILTQDYDVIVWKQCFPVSDPSPDTGSPDVASDVKTVENYKLQYEALKDKMRQFPETRFIVWTGAALVEGITDEASAGRAEQFFEWVKETWDEPGDNIFVWDFRELETEGGLYLLDEHAAGPTDSHPNSAFAERVAPLLGQRVADVIEGRGDTGSLTGQ